MSDGGVTSTPLGDSDKRKADGISKVKGVTAEDGVDVG